MCRKSFIKNFCAAYSENSEVIFCLIPWQKYAKVIVILSDSFYHKVSIYLSSKPSNFL